MPKGRTYTSEKRRSLVQHFRDSPQSDLTPPTKTERLLLIYHSVQQCKYR